MTTTIKPPAADDRIARLSTASVRKVLEPEELFDWDSLGKGQVIGDELLTTSGLEPEVVARLLTIPSLVALTAALADELAEAQAAGEIRPDVDPAEVAVGLETIVLALLMAELQTGLTVEPERQAGVLAVMDAALRPSS